MNQTQKNVQSTKVEQIPFKIAEYPEMRGKNVQDIYISTYDVRKVHSLTKMDNSQPDPNKETNTS